MNREELREVLSRKGVNESLYSLDGLARQSESYSLVEGGGGWRVVYKERGKYIDLGVNLSEADACNMVYGLFRDAFDWSEVLPERVP